MRIIFMIFLGIYFSTENIFACIGNITTVLEVSKGQDGIQYEMEALFDGKFTVNDNDGFFSTALLYNSMVQEIGRKNIPYQCVRTENVPTHCSISEESKRIYKRYKSVVIRNLQRTRAYINKLKTQGVCERTSIEEEITSALSGNRPKNVCDEVLEDMAKVLDSFNNENNKDRGIFSSLAHLRNFLKNNNYLVSYSVNTQRGEQTWTPYYRDSEHQNILGAFEDVDIREKPPVSGAKGLGCGSSIRNGDEVIHKLSGLSDTQNSHRSRGSGTAQ